MVNMYSQNQYGGLVVVVNEKNGKHINTLF